MCAFECLSVCVHMGFRACVVACLWGLLGNGATCLFGFVCLCVCRVCVCMYVCVLLYIRVLECLFLYFHVFVCRCSYLCEFICVRAYLYVCVYLCAHEHIENVSIRVWGCDDVRNTGEL